MVARSGPLQLWVLMLASLLILGRIAHGSFVKYEHALSGVGVVDLACHRDRGQPDMHCSIIRVGVALSDNTSLPRR
ncbi:hypothetical protein C8Q77DRAFT_1089308 [Trametes polyzona]|nr:hypothetical protein C8Q77DRAFT_1089308 [Trametes polyzona]